MLMEWKGEPLETWGDIGRAMVAVYRIEDAEERQREADAFMDAYRAVSPHADANVGYLTGYYAPETMKGMLALFRARHPIFGGPEEAIRPPDEVFEMGVKMGSRMIAEEAS